MDINKYNTKVRRAISDEYIKCSKRRGEFLREVSIIQVKLSSEAEILSYREYKQLEKKAESLLKEIEKEKIRLEIWDAAREICLDIADEV